MKNILLFLLALTMLVAFTCKKSETTTTTTLSEAVNESPEQIIHNYYSYLENRDTLPLAYEMSTKKVDYEKFASWYQLVKSITLSDITPKSDTEFNYIVTLVEYKEATNQDKTQTYLFDVTMTIVDNKIVGSITIPLDNPDEELSNEDIIKKYYRYMANDDTIDKAYEMSTKKVSFEKYRSWYINVASINLSKITLVGDDEYNFIVYYTEYKDDSRDALVPSLYDVTMVVKDGKIVSSVSKKIKKEPDNLTYTEEIDEDYYGDGMGGKPVIYLYPKEESEIFVNVATKLGIHISDPPLNNGWNVTAYPDGTIINKDDNKEYPYLFWEAYQNEIKKSKKGFCVARQDLSTFFDDTLSTLGLNEKEIADFKEFWLKELNKYPYYFITFISESEINRVFPLTLTPEPDSIIRVLFDYRGYNRKIKVKEQKLAPKKRSGYAVVEWGGLLYR